MTNRRSWFVLAVSIFLAGCAGLSPRPDRSRFYTLAPIAGAASESARVANPDRAGFSLGLGPIEFPGYLDRPQVATRRAANRLDFSENDRWAEPLAESFTSVLAENLSTLLKTDRISIYPWGGSARPDYQIKLNVSRFETMADQQAELVARWEVLDGRSRKSLYAAQSRFSRPAASQSTEAAVAALSEVLGDLSRDIAQALLSLARQGG